MAGEHPTSCLGPVIRRDFLRAGFLGLGGLGLGDLLHARAASETHTDTACIFIWLGGGPSVESC